MTLTLTTVTCHMFPAFGSWWSLKLASVLPQVVSVPDRVYMLGSLLASLIYPFLTLLILFVVDLGEWVGGRTGVEGPGSARGWFGSSIACT